jgi:predicted RNA polymerase sigma factor
VTADVDRVFREEHGRAVAVLTRVFGDLDVAEDAVQEAFAEALRSWPEAGVPPAPAGWIVTTARRRAIDRLRREAARADRQAQVALLHAREDAAEEDDVEDERLRLIFTCCHPALAPGASAGLGVILLASAAAMLVPALAGHDKAVASAVMALSAARFAVTGIAELTGDKPWMTTAGWTGIALAALSLYAALAFELEGTTKRDVLPLLRRGKAAAAVDASPQQAVGDLAREPGVREQL